MNDEKRTGRTGWCCFLGHAGLDPAPTRCPSPPVWGTPEATRRTQRTANHGTHAEAIDITFESEDYKLQGNPRIFLQIHDPSTLKTGKGNDAGMS